MALQMRGIEVQITRIWSRVVMRKGRGTVRYPDRGHMSSKTSSDLYECPIVGETTCTQASSVVTMQHY